MRFVIASVTSMLLVAAIFAGTPRAYAIDRCLYSACSAQQRLFGTGLRQPPLYRSPNDLYNERNQERYRSGIKAKPFDPGSPIDPTRGLNSTDKNTFNDDHPEARNEHVRWCLKRYKSYAVATNTYVTYDGRTRYCDSPFR